MAERNSGDDQDRRPGDDQEDGPGEKKTMLVKSQPRPQAPGKGLPAPGNDLVPDQETLLPDNHSLSTKSGTTEIGQGRRKGRKEQKPGESHRPLVSSKAVMLRARTAKEKKKEKKKERIKGSSVKENRAKEKVSQARWEVARRPHTHLAKDLPQPWWNQATASILRMSRNTRTTVRKRKVPRQRPGSSWCRTLPL